MELLYETFSKNPAYTWRTEYDLLYFRIFNQMQIDTIFFKFRKAYKIKKKNTCEPFTKIRWQNAFLISELQDK